MKRTLALLLTAAILLCAAPLAGFAAINRSKNDFGSLFTVSAKAAEIVASGTCGEVDEDKGLDGSNLTWTLDSDGLLTISGNGKMQDYGWNCSPWYKNTSVQIVIIQNDVTSIGIYAFSGCAGLASVTIPDSVTSIGNMAFSGCAGLASVTIPDYVTSIGDGAFTGCKGLTSVTVPDSVTSIGDGAFANCAGLTSVKIGNSVAKIGGYAFGGCAGLTSVTIPDSVTSIGNGAFSNCAGLTSVTIPPSVTEIGGAAVPESTVIYGYAGSYAQQWAEENDRAFEVIEMEPEPAYALGDVDGNGKVESADARLALRASVKLEKDITEGTAAYTAADVNNDGKVGSDDARKILRVSVKLESFQ